MNFVEELNEAIGPMLFAEETGDGTFKLRMKETPFIESAMLNVSKQFKATVERIGEKHFGAKPMFNNTETTWWF